jgi:hypothetical protein
MKLWARAATCITAVFLVGWYFVYGQDMLTEINSAQRDQNQQLAEYQDCENFRHTGVSKLPADLMDFDCKYLAPRERPEIFSYWQMTADYLKPVIGLLFAIWGCFAGLQWLIRGAMP